ncbi:hypothetical protein Q7A_03435 [Methylophaga nitratireducenticrescens]|nr:hypothetical protein Q7A_03435 [Methylophaga nitratireducenticrescens]
MLILSLNLHTLAYDVSEECPNPAVTITARPLTNNFSFNLMAGTNFHGIPDYAAFTRNEICLKMDVYIMLMF